MSNENNEADKNTGSASGVGVQRVVMRILEQETIKPDQYHFVCGGGSALRMVDVYSNSPEYQCSMQGDKSAMTPMCEKCTGLEREEKQLTDLQRRHNRDIKDFAEKLVAALDA